MMAIEERHYPNGRITFVFIIHYFDEDTGLLVTDIIKEIDKETKQ
jgi:hypothetical protein